MDRAHHVGEPVTERRSGRNRRLAALSLSLALLAAAPAFAEEPETEFVPRATRNVTPPGMTPGPEVDGPLFRDRPPAPEVKPETAKWRRFLLPETSDTATLHARNLTIRIVGWMEAKGL